MTDFEKIKELLGKAEGLELNKLKNLARMSYALGRITEEQWKELERIADERYGK